ncbi:MAG: hypothetical protein IMZ44_23675 [Planctomycetes bacterium]|nr:hypothetical protein [Planctomycetota bacterium]
MGYPNPRADAEAFVDGPVTQYVRDTGTAIYGLAAEKYTVLSKRGQVSPADAQSLLRKMGKDLPADHRLRDALDLRDGPLQSILRSHDDNPALRKMAEGLPSDTPWLAKVFFSGVSRFLFHRLEGKDEHTALAQVADSFKTLFAGRGHPCDIGATMVLKGVPDGGIQLGPEVWLRPLSEQEYELAGHETSRLFAMSVEEYRPPQARWVAIIKTGVPRSIDTYWDVTPSLRLRGPYLQEIRSLLAFLQLELARDIQPGHLFIINSEWFPNIYGRAYRLSDYTGPYQDPRRYRQGKEVEVTDQKAEELKARWPQYQAAMSNGRFSLACSRYSLSLQRDTVDDSIIDHWIALESLFTESDKEIGSMAASKIAILLGGKLDQRKTTRCQIRQHYGIRSCLVHGRKGLDKSFREFHRTFGSNAPRAEPEYYAAAMSRAWVEQALRLVAWDPKILSELDDALVSGDLGFQRQVPGYWKEKLRHAGVVENGARSAKNEGESGGERKG